MLKLIHQGARKMIRQREVKVERDISILGFISSITEMLSHYNESGDARLNCFPTTLKN